LAKRIMNNITVFAIRTQSNSIKGDSVFLSKEHAEYMNSQYMYDGYDTYIDSIELPFVGKYVSYVQIYRGFDYGIGNIYDVCYKSELYPSVESAKQNNNWKKIVERSINQPEEFNVYKDKICNKDWGGHDWYYGDVMEGKVNAEIKKLKVVR